MKDQRTYVPEYDTLRAAFALAVIVSHCHPLAGIPVLGHVEDRLGPLAVDMFFALSGYLITGILTGCRGLASVQPAGATIRRFYARRFLRIMPLYYLALALFVAAGPCALRAKLPWFLTGTVNIGKAISPSGWLPLNHFWALAVEQQFYAAWPFLILLCSPRTVLRACAVGMVVGPLSRIVLACAGANEYAVAQLTPCCLDPLVLGAAFAVLRAENRPTDRLARLSILGGGISSTLLLLLAPDGVFYVLSPLAYAFFFAGAIAAIPARSGSEALRLLRIPPVLSLGRMSYGLYVWHLPLIWITAGKLPAAPAFLPRGSARALDFLLILALTVLVSAVSWRFFEEPLNALKDRFPYRPDRTQPRG